MRIETQLTNTLTRQARKADDRPGYWLEPVNPDGARAAEYIRETLTHVGYITYLALNHIEDETVKAEISRRARLIMAGAKQ